MLLSLIKIALQERSCVAVVRCELRWPANKEETDESGEGH